MKTNSIYQPLTVSNILQVQNPDVALDKANGMIRFARRCFKHQLLYPHIQQLRSLKEVAESALKEAHKDVKENMLSRLRLLPQELPAEDTLAADDYAQDLEEIIKQIEVCMMQTRPLRKLFCNHTKLQFFPGSACKPHTTGFIIVSLPTSSTVGYRLWQYHFIDADHREVDVRVEHIGDDQKISPLRRRARERVGDDKVAVCLLRSDRNFREAVWLDTLIPIAAHKVYQKTSL